MCCTQLCSASYTTPCESESPSASNGNTSHHAHDASCLRATTFCSCESDKFEKLKSTLVTIGVCIREVPGDSQHYSCSIDVFVGLCDCLNVRCKFELPTSHAIAVSRAPVSCLNMWPVDVCCCIGVDAHIACHHQATDVQTS